jgi:hypothetical protein
VLGKRLREFLETPNTSLKVEVEDNISFWRQKATEGLIEETKKAIKQTQAKGEAIRQENQKLRNKLALAWSDLQIEGSHPVNDLVESFKLKE